MLHHCKFLLPVSVVLCTNNDKNQQLLCRIPALPYSLHAGKSTAIQDVLKLHIKSRAFGLRKFQIKHLKKKKPEQYYFTVALFMLSERLHFVMAPLLDVHGDLKTKHLGEKKRQSIVIKWMHAGL